MKTFCFQGIVSNKLCFVTAAAATATAATSQVEYPTAAAARQRSAAAAVQANDAVNPVKPEPKDNDKQSAGPAMG